MENQSIANAMFEVPVVYHVPRDQDNVQKMKTLWGNVCTMLYRRIRHKTRRLARPVSASIGRHILRKRDQVSRLLDLPRELRDMIYNEHIRGTIRCFKARLRPIDMLSMLHTCTQMRDEMSRILIIYKKAEFDFGTYAQPLPHLQWKQQPGLRGRIHISSDHILEVNILMAFLRESWAISLCLGQGYVSDYTPEQTEESNHRKLQQHLTAMLDVPDSTGPVRITGIESHTRERHYNYFHWNPPFKVNKTLLRFCSGPRPVLELWLLSARQRRSPQYAHRLQILLEGEGWGLKFAFCSLPAAYVESLQSVIWEHVEITGNLGVMRPLWQQDLRRARKTKR